MKRSSVPADGETSPRLDDVHDLAAENHRSGMGEASGYIRPRTGATSLRLSA
jgi:hypothetical protein